MVSIGLFPGMQRARVLLLLSASLLLAGCASIPPTPKANEEYLRAHYILAHEDGFALSITERQYFVRKRLSAKAAKEDIEARIIAGVDAHALRLWPNLGEKEEGEKAKGDALQLMVYAHGGLNGYGEDL